MAINLVTGGAGFIGSHLVQALLARGDTVRVLDNFSTGKRENLADLAGPLTVIEGDLRDPLAIEPAVAGVDFIFHQAAFVSVPLSLADPQTCFEINVQGTLNLLDAARQAGVQRVVMASSAAVYGDSQQYPLREDRPTTSLSPYAASKRVTELYTDLYTRAMDLEVVALRYFNIFGPRQRPDSDYAAAIPIFASRMLAGKPVTIHGDGLQSRDFVYVADVVRANILASQAPQAPGKAFNICSGKEFTILDLVEALQELIPGSLPLEFGPPRPGDIYRSVGDPSRAQDDLGFTPETSLLDGLSQTLEWMRR